MGSLRRNRAFDPLDLEIIDRAYEAAWAQVEADIFRDIAKDDERKTALRQWVFILAGSHPVDFDTLSDSALSFEFMASASAPSMIASTNLSIFLVTRASSS